VIILKCCR